jgi:hypothetical protein
MYFFLAVIVVAMLRNAAGATGILVGLGDAGTKFTNALTGGTASGAKGTITTSGGSKIALG